jgi:putative NADH-flavin reductase
MKIIIFGASGFSGQAILKEALSKNHQITVLVRNANSITINHENLTIIEDTILDKNILNSAISGQNLVIMKR